jgi:formate-dependent nitrite reductase membrane component NrfD
MGLLIVDLGRPMRFLHMLRVFKPTSPLSVGSYILSPFSALTVATAGLQALPWFPAVRALKVARWIPGLRKAAAARSAVFGGPMTTYTAVLLASTATPSWHEPHDELPFLFAGSGRTCSFSTSTSRPRSLWSRVRCRRRGRRPWSSTSRLPWPTRGAGSPSSRPTCAVPR